MTATSTNVHSCLTYGVLPMCRTVTQNKRAPRTRASRKKCLRNEISMLRHARTQREFARRLCPQEKSGKGASKQPRCAVAAKRWQIYVRRKSEWQRCVSRNRAARSERQFYKREGGILGKFVTRFVARQRGCRPSVE